MAKKLSNAKPRGAFNLGGEEAEADPLLGPGFYSSMQYASLASRSDPRCFLIGRTGSGKSAILRQIDEENPDHVIRINPEDLSLPYIADLDIIRYLNSLNVHLDPLFIALWKHVLLIEIIKHRYKVNSPAAKQNFLQGLRERISRDKSKAAALDYLEDFEGKFWCETDERVRDITTKFEEQIKAEASGNVGTSGVGLRGGGANSATTSRETRTQEADRFQRIVNETQLPRLNKMMSVLDDDILNTPQLYTYIILMTWTGIG